MKLLSTSAVRTRVGQLLSTEQQADTRLAGELVAGDEQRDADAEQGVYGHRHQRQTERQRQLRPQRTALSCRSAVH